MQWRALDITPRDVTLANGESLQTLASFQGSDGDHDIIKAHVALDAGDLVLLTEFEDAAGKRQLGRTTQWPREIIYHCLNSPTPAFFDAVDAEPVMLDQGDAPNTETNPEEAKTGGSGDPAAPAGEPELTLEELAASDDVLHGGPGDPDEMAKTQA